MLREIYKDGQPPAGTPVVNPSIPYPPNRTTPLFVTYPDYHDGQFFPPGDNPIINPDPYTSLTTLATETSGTDQATNGQTSSSQEHRSTTTPTTSTHTSPTACAGS